MLPQLPWLPPGAHAVHISRDFWLLDLPTNIQPPHANRVAVILDIDADARVLSALASLTYRDMRVTARVLAFAESKGVVQFWMREPQEDDHRALQSSVNAALRISREKWIVAPIKEIATVNGRAFRSAIEADEQLRVIPSRFQLGLVAL